MFCLKKLQGLQWKYEFETLKTNFNSQEKEQFIRMWKNTELNLNACKCDINKAKKEEHKLFHYSMLTISGGKFYKWMNTNAVLPG